MIEIANLTKRFGPVTAVDGLTAKVERGEIFGIVGPDGAGKSTLLRLIAAILTPSGGSVAISGLDSRTHAHEIKEGLAYMPQRFGLYEDLTVEENIRFFGRLYGVTGKEIRARLPRLYAFSRLEPFRDRLAGKLSGGMKQKLGLACCLVHAPGLVLLDEPTNGVDPVSRREFWRILYDLLGEGVTIVVSTAYLDEAERCNRIALMYGGRFIVTGSPRAVKAGIGKPFIEFVTDDPRRAEEALSHIDEFRAVMMAGRRLRLFVDDARKAEKGIRKALAAGGIKVVSFRETTPGLEDAFVEIISGGVAP
ncbi:MAG: ABC transporter ATP-binding protein [Spirochaetes bacterium]|nr:MAG: ABC transporter ATP-binding protein [Spirochaetota bacterium]